MSMAEGEEKLVKFDCEGNTEADILVDELSAQITSNRHASNISSTHPHIQFSAAKSQLYEICAVYHWKPPLLECCKEERPSHIKLFTFKVIVEIEGRERRVVECYGEPKPNKKTAAGHAAEGALWYLKQSGYIPINKLNKGKPVIG